jgi:hypothetical protein
MEFLDIIERATATTKSGKKRIGPSKKLEAFVFG